MDEIGDEIKEDSRGEDSRREEKKGGREKLRGGSGSLGAVMGDEMKERID